MIGDFLDQNTFDQLMSQALALVPNTIDKRQGAIIYDTLAVSNVQLAQAYIFLKGYYLNSYGLTAEGEYLEMRAAERGIERSPATYAVKLGTFLDNSGRPVSVPIGTLFSTSEDTSALIYAVTAQYANPTTGAAVPGQYQLTCETAGAVGNDYIGPLIRLTYISGIATATLSDLLIPGSDTEGDDSLRQRYLEDVRQTAFGGNVAQYRKWVLAMDGVGAVQVYPVWNGGGTVKVSILGADYNPASTTLIDQVQTALDPTQNQGEGLGIAPIGHVVTVDTPEAFIVDVTAEINLQSGWSIGQVQEPIETAIEAYLFSLRQEFGQSEAGPNIIQYSINIYRARISAFMMGVEGVENVPTVLLNGEDADISLTETAQLQQVPTRGEVTLNAV